MQRITTTYLIFCAAALAALSASYFSSASTLTIRWETNQESYSHGYFILASCLFLIFRQFKILKRTSISPYFPGLAILFSSVIMWLVARETSTRVIEQSMLPAILFSAILTLFGLSVARRLIFPFAIFYTVIPLWDFLTFPLQKLTVSVASLILDAIGMPTFITGNMITIPAGTFEVANGCSGLNYLLMSTTLALLYSHLYHKKVRETIVMLIYGILIGLLCNWTRVTALIIVGHITEMRSPIISDHENLGLAIFAVYIIPLIYLGRKLESTQAPSATARNDRSNTKIWWFFSPLLVTVVALPAASWKAELNTPVDRKILKLQFVDLFTELALVDSSAPPWGPNYRHADMELNLRALSPSKTTVSIRSYFSQSQGKELIHSDNSLLFNNQWTQIFDSQISTPQGHNITLTVVKQSSNGNHYQILYWYQFGTKTGQSPIWAKAMQIYQLISQRTDASLLTISQVCSDNCEIVASSTLALADNVISKHNSIFNQLTAEIYSN